MQNSKTERESRSVMRTAGAEVEQLSRRSLLIGLAAGAALSVPLLSKPAEAAVSMLRNGVDPDLVEPDTIDVGRRGGRGRGGRGRGRGRGRGHSFRRGGGRRFHGRGRSFRGRGRRYHGRRWRGGRRWYGGWGVSRCYDPWYRRVYWWRCRGIWLY